MDGFEKGPEIKELTNEPEIVGEMPHSLPDTNDWDSLRDVPFAGGDGTMDVQNEADWDSLVDVPFAGDTSE